MSTEAEIEQQKRRIRSRTIRPLHRGHCNVVRNYWGIRPHRHRDVLGGSPYAFIDLPSICIVIGGTFGITVACYSFRDVGTAFRIVMSTVFYHTRSRPPPPYTYCSWLNSHAEEVRSLWSHMCRVS